MSTMARPYNFKRQDPTVSQTPLPPTPPNTVSKVINELTWSPPPIPSPILETNSEVVTPSSSAVAKHQPNYTGDTQVLTAPSTVMPSPAPSRPSIAPSTTYVQPDTLPDVSLDRMSPFYNPYIDVKRQQAKMAEVKEAGSNPLGYIADKGMTDIGILAFGVNPAAALTASVLGAGVSEAVTYGFTGKHLTPTQLVKAGVQSAGISAASGVVLQGAAKAYGAVNKSVIAAGMRREVVPVVQKAGNTILQRAGVAGKVVYKGASTEPIGAMGGSKIWYGMKTEIAPVFSAISSRAAPTVGRASVMAGIGGATSYVSTGDIEEAGKQAAISAALSVGLEAFAAKGLPVIRKKYSAMKEILGSKTKAKGSAKTPLEFPEVPEGVDYKSLPSSMADDLRKMKANAEDPIYQALHPKDAALEAEARWGSKKPAMFTEAELARSQQPVDVMGDFEQYLLPEKYASKIAKNAESRWGSVAEVPATREATAGRGVSAAGKMKWEIKAAKFEAQKAANPNYDLEQGILGKQPYAKPLTDVMNWDAIYSKETVTFKRTPAELLAMRQGKWSDRAWNFKLNIKSVLGEKVPELPKNIGDYIVGKPQGKWFKSSTSAGTEVKTSSGQVLIQLEKAVTETAVKTTTKQAAMPTVMSVVTAQPKVATKQNTAQQSKQRSQVSFVFDNIVAIKVKPKVVQKQPQIHFPWQGTPQTPIPIQDQPEPTQPDQPQPQKPQPIQQSGTIAKQLTRSIFLQKNINKRKQITKPVRRRNIAAEQIIKNFYILPEQKIPKFISTGLSSKKRMKPIPSTASIIFGKQQKRRRSGRRK